MTGLEHYREAERLLESTQVPYTPGKWRPDSDLLIAKARVHAMLAMVAANAVPDVHALGG